MVLTEDRPESHQQMQHHECINSMNGLELIERANNIRWSWKLDLEQVGKQFFKFIAALLTHVFEIALSAFKVRIDQANPFTPVSHALPAQHGWVPSAWPYQACVHGWHWNPWINSANFQIFNVSEVSLFLTCQAEDFSRMDESGDAQMRALHSFSRIRKSFHEALKTRDLRYDSDDVCHCLSIK